MEYSYQSGILLLVIAKCLLLLCAFLAYELFTGLNRGRTRRINSRFYYIEANLVPRFSLLPFERPWLGLVTCLPESGRLQTNDLGEGRISVRVVSTKRRRRGQWKLCIRPCLKDLVFYSSRISQDKTSNAESFDSESVTSCRISGCLSDVAKEITDSSLVQSKIF